VSEEKRVALEDVRQAMRDVLHEEMGDVCHGLLEGKFYQNLTLEMEDGIGAMYKEINTFKKALNITQQTADESKELISHASDQLEEIVKTTEEATNQIMDAVEACQQRNMRAAKLLAGLPASEERNEIQMLFGLSNQDYMNIITSCSFQDLTGQRVRTVVELIKTLEKQLVTILLRTGTKIREKKAGTEDHAIESKAQEIINQIKAEDTGGIDQAQVDELLASLMS